MEFQSQGKVFEKPQEKVAACQPRGSTSTSSRDLVCRNHDRQGCIECMKPVDPSHHCQASAMIGFCQDCGVRFPVVADACQSPDKLSKMPVAEGSVEGTPVKVL